MPPDAIVNDARVRAQYDADVENWGERVQAAGGRLCRWFVGTGATLPFSCPTAPQAAGGD